MKIAFTKMQGAGNDFIVLDETAGLLGLAPAQIRWLADRHFGIGADQVLSVRAAPSPDVDFEYVIHNADGGEVEQCGNGARCFARFVRDRGLTQKNQIKVQTRGGVITPRLHDDGRVTVDMGAPVFDLALVPFDATGLVPLPQSSWQKWPLALDGRAQGAIVDVAVLSMGNPHAVLWVPDVEAAPVALQGPAIERHPRFSRRVNAGFAERVDARHLRLRVYERGAGETLACGTGACAAVVAGIRLGLLDADAPIDVATRGGLLTIAWAGDTSPVFMTGPAETVFEGWIDLPNLLDLPDLPNPPGQPN